jgi:hypothetical protein
VTSIHELGGATRGTLLHALGWLRNRVLHDRQEAVLLDTTMSGTFGTAPFGTQVFGDVSTVWLARWRPRAELPTPTRQDAPGEAAYDAYLAGESVFRTLRAALIELRQRAR